MRQQTQSVQKRALTRPPLRAIPLADLLPLGSRRVCIITMSVGQWDAVLSSSYEVGFVLLELDDDERPVGAYQRADAEFPGRRAS